MKKFGIIAAFLLVPLFSASGQTAEITPDSIPEYLLHGYIIRVTVTPGGDFDDFDSQFYDGNFVLHNNPSGMSISGRTRINDTIADLEISWTGNIDTDITDLYVEIDGLAFSQGDNEDILTDFITIEAYDEPTADISGGGTICDAGSKDITITFTGNNPFRYSYEIDGNTHSDITVHGMDTTLTFTVGTVYELTAVYDSFDILGTIGDASASVVIETTPSPSIAGESSVCSESIETYSTTSNSSNTYLWEVSSQGSFAGVNDSYQADVEWGSGSSQWIKVTETSPGGCSDYDSVDVNLLDVPTGHSISGPTGFCTDSTIELNVEYAAGGINAYQWYLDGSAYSANATIQVSDAGGYKVEIQGSNGCWSNRSAVHSVNAFKKPVGEIDKEGNSGICLGVKSQIVVEVSNRNSPWTAVYLDEKGGIYDTIRDIDALEEIRDVWPGSVGWNEYTLIDVWDQNCPGEVDSHNDNARIEINASPDIVFTGGRTEAAITDPSYEFSATPTGGTWSCPTPRALDANGWFGPGDAGEGKHEVSYTVTEDGCSTTENIIVTVYTPRGNFSAPNSYDNGTYKYIYCYDQVADQISMEDLYIPKGKVFLTGYFLGNGISPFNHTTAYFYPAVAGDGIHKIEYHYTLADSVTHLSDPSDNLVTEEIVVDKLSEINAVYIDREKLMPEYCLNDDTVRLDIRGSILSATFSAGDSSYSGDGIFEENKDKFYFDPGAAGAGDHFVKFTYLRDGSQCTIKDSVLVRVHSLANIDFDVPDRCIYTDASISDSIQFVNTSADSASVHIWSWDFGDPLNSLNDTSSIMHPWYDYNSAGNMNVSIDVVDKNGCANSLSKLIQLGPYPPALFEWEKECDVDTLELSAEPGLGQELVKTYSWDFGDGVSLAGDEWQESGHHYLSAGSYDIWLKTTTAFGCSDSVMHAVPIRTTYTITSMSDPYFEDFDTYDITNRSDWVSSSVAEGGSSSWSRNLAAGNVINKMDSLWVVSPNGFYSNMEHSYVEGPCYDFSRVNKPMIKFDYWVHAEDERDGAVLQASDDDGKTWKVVGSNEDGINWFNSALLTGNPGDQRLGWTGTTQTEWLEARNLLDGISHDRVRFRFVFGADAVASDYEGFAFDNIWIGERSRMVLLEHFTNTAVSAAETADSTVSRIVCENSGEVIDINYHTSFPAPDTWNEYYQPGPGSRAYYYGIDDVPVSVMDGKEVFAGINKSGDYSWTEGALLKNVLNDPLIDIDMSSSDINGNELVADLKLKLLDPALALEDLILYLALAENVRIGNTPTKVLRSMIPNTGGTSLMPLWNGSDSVKLVHYRSFDPADFENSDSLYLIAFVQINKPGSELDKTVCQAAYVPFTVLATSVERPAGELDGPDFNLYPNPADGLVYIEPAGWQDGKYSLELFNEMGSCVYNEEMEKGAMRLGVDISAMPPGIYFVRLGTKSRQSVKRLVIIR